MVMVSWMVIIIATTAAFDGNAVLTVAVSARVTEVVAAAQESCDFAPWQMLLQRPFPFLLPLS